MTERICVGAIAGSFGVQGEVRLKSFCADPEAIADYGPLWTEDGARSFTLKLTRSVSGGLGGRLSGVATKEQADALKGVSLYADRDRLPSLPDDEFYHADLLGLPVVTDAGDAVGSVLAIENFGATDLIEITRDPAPEKGPKTFMVPMIPAAVIGWDDKQLVIAADFADN